MMKLMTFLSLAACCLSLSCSFSRNRASDNASNANTPSVGSNEELPVEDIESEGFKPMAKELDTEYVYVFENDTIRQRVALNYLTDTVIRFEYTVENTMQKQHSIIRGTAKNKYSGYKWYDPEIDQDEEGLAYPADEYVYSNQCWLAFRIHMQTQALLQIMEADCQPNPYCPLESAGILKLVKQYKTGEKAVHTLEEFYTEYISACDSPAGNGEAMTAMKNKYLAKALLEKLEGADLDYDPLIQAQDCDGETVKTLEIKPDAEQENVYSVCYTWSDGEKICIRLLLTEVDGSYLIADILSDANIHGNV
jgi:hypothetical protein